MRSTVVVLVLLFTLPLVGGCASSANLGTADGWKVYGGAQLDATLISEGFAPAPETAQSKKIERSVRIWEGCCGLVDMPFSFAADTVLLPITVPIALLRGPQPLDMPPPAKAVPSVSPDQ